MKANGNLDAADLVKAIADTASTSDEREMAAYMFMREIEEIIDERVAIALEKRFPVTVATAGEPVKQVLGDIQKMLHGIEAAIVSPLDYDAPTGMSDPRS